MKTVSIGVILLVFLVSYNLYLYTLANSICDARIMKLWNYYSIGGLLLGIFLHEWIGIDNYFQFQFVNISKIVVLLTIITILLTNHGILTSPYYPLSMLDLGTAIATCMFLISGYRHGYFNR